MYATEPPVVVKIELRSSDCVLLVDSMVVLKIRVITIYCVPSDSMTYGAWVTSLIKANFRIKIFGKTIKSIDNVISNEKVPMNN